MATSMIAKLAAFVVLCVASVVAVPIVRETSPVHCRTTPVYASVPVTKRVTELVNFPKLVPVTTSVIKNVSVTRPVKQTVTTLKEVTRMVKKCSEGQPVRCKNIPVVSKVPVTTTVFKNVTTIRPVSQKVTTMKEVTVKKEVTKNVTTIERVKHMMTKCSDDGAKTAAPVVPVSASSECPPSFGSSECSSDSQCTCASGVVQVDLGSDHDHCYVCEHPGQPEEEVVHVDFGNVNGNPDFLDGLRDDECSDGYEWDGHECKEKIAAAPVAPVSASSDCPIAQWGLPECSSNSQCTCASGFVQADHGDWGPSDMWGHREQLNHCYVCDKEYEEESLPPHTQVHNQFG